MTTSGARPIFFVAALCSCCAGLCQQPNIPSPIVPQVLTIDLSHVIPLPSLPASGLTGDPSHCSSDGDIYLEIYGTSSEGTAGVLPDLYRIAFDGAVKLIPRPAPHQDFSQFAAMSFFPGAHSLVSLLQAFHPLGQPASSTDRKLYFFLSVTDQDGDHGKSISLDATMNPFKAAVLPSGQFLVLGLDQQHRIRLALLKEDGTFIRDLAIDPEPQDETAPASPDGNASSARVIEPPAKATTQPLKGADFEPWGDDVVLIVPGTGTRIYRIRESGEFDVVQPHLPRGYVIQGILGSGGRDTWVLRVMKSTTADEFAKKGIIENPLEYLVEANPADGEVLRELDVKGPRPGEVDCAANGKLESVYFGGDPRPGLPDQLTLGSAPR